MNFQTSNPYTGMPLNTYKRQTSAEALKCIEEFKAHQKIWASWSLERRATVLKKLSQVIRLEKQVLAKQASLEMGKPITIALLEVEKCAATIESIAGMAVVELKDRTLAAHYSETKLKPVSYGLVFSIQPWNFPYWQAFRMAACAWMAGNLVVLKHADIVAGCAELIEKVCDLSEMKLLLNIKVDHEVAAEIIKSPLISMVTLTGSTSAGKQVGAVAGAALKKQLLELGGSDAYIIMPDSDLQSAVKICVKARLTNSGQSCIAAKRFYVHDSIYDNFKKLFLDELSTYKTGDPLEPETQVGPLASQKFVQIINQQIENAIAEGGRLEVAQKPPEKSFSVMGLIDFGCKLEAFSNEEVFGPIACFYKFKNVDDVVETINKGIFGLGGGIFTKNMELAYGVANKIETGSFVINTYVQSDARVPFGGVKESGLGCELGTQGLYEFIHWKVIGVQK